MLKAFDEGRIFGVTHGSPPIRVLALPGWLHTVTDFAGVLETLPVGSIALDLPGFGGATPEPAQASGAAGYAAAVAPVLAADVDAPAVIVGHSFGGRVAVHLAASHPDRVGGLVLCGVPGLCRRTAPARRPATKYRVARALHKRGLLGDERMERMRRSSGSADYRNAPSPTMRNVLVAVTNEHYEEQLQAITCPVRLVWGERDDQAPVEIAARAAALLGERARLSVHPGVGHFVPTEAPQAVSDAVRELLA